MTLPEDVGAQTENTLATIEKALAEGGFAMNQVVRATYYVTSTDHVETVMAVTGRVFGAIRPAATMLICDLIKPEMKVEIEVTAFRG